MSALPSGGRPMLVIGDSLDDAGYLYHDLSRVLGESAVLMFPSGYKRSIKYGQVDPPSQIMRTEVLNHWFDDPSLRYVVTYPEALAEHVATRDTIEAHTLQLAVGSTVDLAETEKWLRENGFQEVDYVYDPGHFAVRGSILDIYGYSCEEPFRIDFSATKSSRYAHSTSKHSSRSQSTTASPITSNVSQQGKGESLLDYIPADTLLWVRDADYTLQRIEAISTETFSDSALIADEGDKDALKHVVEPDRFAESLKSMRQIRFSAAANADADASAAIDFGCTPQGIYHKNFDLISDSLLKFIGDGYTVYILSDSEKQIERLRAIFEDRATT